MIDTAKLVVPYSEPPDWLHTARLQRIYDPVSGRIKAIGNARRADKLQGIYKPRITYTEQVRAGHRRTYQLAIELSLPKLIYGNNFTELTDADFIRTAQELAGSLKTHYGITVTPQQLESATVAKIDYSKNIVFTDYTPVSSIVRHMSKAHIAKTYDVQKTDFKNGGLAYHAKHTNGLDVVMYDKIADLRQSAVSEKRTEEKDGYIQKDILEIIGKNNAISVARFEVRFNRTRKLRDELVSTGIASGLTFRELFSTDVSRKVLTRHWDMIFERIPKNPLDANTPEQLLLSIKKCEPTITYTNALARIGYDQLASQLDARSLRTLTESLFTPSQYRRFMQKTRDPPGGNQLKTLVTVSDTLTAMEPVRLTDYIL